MNEQSTQGRLLILLAAVICAVLIGYNAFYVPDATMAWASSSSQASAATVGSKGSSATVSIKQGGVSSADGNGLAQVPGQAATPSASSGKININTASAQQLSDGLKGIGTTLSGRIVDYREKHGPFRSIDDIKKVSGIGDKTFESIRNSITVE